MQQRAVKLVQQPIGTLKIGEVGEELIQPDQG